MTRTSLSYKFRVEISGPFDYTHRTHFRLFKKYQDQDTEQSFK